MSISGINTSARYTSVSTISGIPAPIIDGHTLAWYIADDLTTITKDGSNLVSRWNDKLASGKDLIQASGTNQPLWTSSGVLFDGVDNFMSTSNFGWAKPTSIYIVYKNITNISLAQLMDSSSLQVWPGNTNGIVSVNAFTGGTVALTLNTFGVLRITIDASNNMTMQMDNGTRRTGTVTCTLSFFCLGSHGSGTLRWSNVQVKEVLLRSVADTSQDETAIYNYLKAKYSL